MVVKNISLLSLLSVFMSMHSNTYQVKRPSLECTGKVAKERQSLFVQAEEQEELFIAAYKKCLEEDNCHNSASFNQIKYDLLSSIVALSEHLEILKNKNDGSCNVCEKNETKSIRNRLLDLLKKY